jgi:hypothetical protein
MQARLKTRTLELVREKYGDPGGVQRLADETGLSYIWVYRFSTGRIDLADADKVEKLYTHVTGRMLDLH